MKNNLKKKWYHSLFQRIKEFSIPNLMMYVAIGMAFIFLVDFIGMFEPMILTWISFSRQQIVAGQVWRLVTFVFEPTSDVPIWFALSLFYYLFLARALEENGGSRSFTHYYLLGMLGAIGGGLLTGSATSSYLNLSLFLAFAQLFPNHELHLFFFLRVKAKWLALLSWVAFAYLLLLNIVTLNLAGAVSLLLALLNFFLFFGPTIYKKQKHRFVHRKLRKEFKRNRDMW